ncbi:MAG: membrane protein insertase YidC [Candidatus Omnitrophota bacterium]|nr:membrane protein insertase YidC [Candidatus Omnitrophota bacterium]
MEKRLILAIALSMMILLTWSAIMPKPQHIENKYVASKNNLIPPVENKSVTPEIKPGEPLPPPDALIKFQNPQYEITFIEPWAAIKEVKFYKYQGTTLNLKSGFLLGEGNLIFKKIFSNQNSITFEAIGQNKRIKKHFIFDNSNYGIWLEINVQSESGISQVVNLPLILGRLDIDFKNPDARFQSMAVANSERTLHANVQKETTFEHTKFLALLNKYFCAIIEPPAGKYGAYVKKVGSKESEIGLVNKEVVLPPGESFKEKFHIYLGPQDLQLIKAINYDWSAVINYGTFDFIAQLLLQLLGLFYALVHNWGWSIVLLSLAVYGLLFPLTLKQMRSMKEMQVLQPKVAALRLAYKDNPQKLNRETLALYKEHKVNPLGGCLPLILQMPIFFALYQALMRSVALKGAHFLWIKDLSEPDRLFVLPFSLPVLSNEINILPILMAIGMFIQQKISLAKGSMGVAAEQQKMMLIMMPLLFGFIFYRMPSGLVLYWFINSALTLVYQMRINRAQ